MVHYLQPDRGSRKARKRVARGSAAGGGTTAGRGSKGQQSRTGKGRRHGFEGGQTPLLRRQPKLGGFRNVGRIVYEIINVETLEKRLDAGSYDVAALAAARIVHGKKPVKLLARGDITKKFDLTVHAASKSARDAVSKAGGTVTITK